MDTIKINFGYLNSLKGRLETYTQYQLKDDEVDRWRFNTMPEKISILRRCIIESLRDYKRLEDPERFILYANYQEKDSKRSRKTKEWMLHEYQPEWFDGKESEFWKMMTNKRGA